MQWLLPSTATSDLGVPDLASASHVAQPMPALAPVTTATLPRHLRTAGHKSVSGARNNPPVYPASDGLADGDGADGEGAD